MIVTASVLQRRILKFILDFSAEHGYPPSFREIMAVAGFTSSSTAQHHVSVLEARGLLTRRQNTPRTMVVTPLGEQVMEKGKAET